MKKNKIILIGIASAILLLIFNHYMENREKRLDVLIDYDLTDFEALIINYQFISQDKKHAEQLIEFMSHYRVKKMKDREWDSNVAGEKGFDVVFQSKKDNPVIVHIYENRMIFLNGGDYYHILNGPVDTTWVDELLKEFEPGMEVK